MLQLAPCVLQSSGGTGGLSPLPTAPELHEVAVGPGDFAGFPGAPGGADRAQGAAPLAHTFVAGDEGMDYLAGGNRPAFDVCVYPLYVAGRGRLTAANRRRCCATAAARAR